MPFSALQRAENSSIGLEYNMWLAAVSFSALQRAENSSIARIAAVGDHNPALSVLFSEPKIPQYDAESDALFPPESFSALQRAENSSITRVMPLVLIPTDFQCSSASRKFLNQVPLFPFTQTELNLSVLFSEPKIPQ